MAYVKQEWKNLPNQTTPANATRMNHIEDGIVKNDIFKNMLYMNYSRGTSTTINGVTFTINDDGSISASGTGTKLGYLWLIYNNNSLELDDDKTYTWSLTTVSGTFVDVARIVSKENSSNLLDITTSVPTRTFKGSYFQSAINCFLRVQPNTVYNYTIKLQLEESSSATDYAPFAGYIVESGSNSNGNWIKYSDGTMICWGYYEKENIAINRTFGSLYECQSFNLGDFSQNFAEIPRVTITKLGTVCAWIESLDNVTRSSLGTANWVRPTAGTYTLAYSYTAIGRWK
jgi:hypothetical protein